MKAEIQQLRIAANRAATALIAGKVGTEGVIKQFVEEAEPHLTSALGLPPDNECESSS